MTAVRRIHRLLRLAESLKSRRLMNASELAGLHGVSRRTIFRDIQTLRVTGVDVVYDEKRQAYRVPMQSLAVATELSEEESLALFVLCHALGAEKTGVPFQAAARSAAIKIANGLPENLRHELQKVAAAIDIRLWPQECCDGSQVVYRTMLQAIRQNRCVRIRSIETSDGETISTRLSPYRLLFCSGGWCVIGRSSLHREIRTFQLTGIADAELLDDRFQVPPRFDPQKYVERSLR